MRAAPNTRYQQRHLGLLVFGVLSLAVLPATPSSAAVTFTTQHDASVTAFDAMLSSTDLIQGKYTDGVDMDILPQDTLGNSTLPGWHPANTDPADHQQAFVDGQGIRPETNLTGLLNDNFPVEEASGRPAKVVHYPFDTPVDIGRINILSGNGNNADGRIFSTTWVQYSTDNGFNFNTLGYFQSDPSGSGNTTDMSTFVSIFDDSSSTMVSGVTNIIFNLYSVSNTANEMRDPYDGVNPFTSVDDGIAAAFESPLILEIDVLEPVEGLVGDHNLDGTVDAADYALWRSDPNSYGGDPQGYNDWVNNFGATLGSGAGGGIAASIPEPNTLMMLFAAVVIGLTRRARIFAGLE
jgi:hypothetical protein